MYTIKREVGRLENIKLGLVGDLANGRTVRSLCMLLSQYSNVQYFFVSPENVRMRDDIKVSFWLSAFGIEHRFHDMYQICMEE